MNKRERRDSKKNTTWIKFVTYNGKRIGRVRFKKSDIKIFTQQAYNLGMTFEEYIGEVIYDYLNARLHASR